MLMAARYDVRGGRFVSSRPREWLQGRLGDTGVLANFDASRDGRIAALMPSAEPDDELPNHATFIINFFDLVATPQRQR